MDNYRTAQAGEQASAQVRCGTNPPHRILVIDDNTCARRSSALVLLDSGYQVDVTEDDAAGWEALNDNSYDLLITGSSLPKVSGVELLKKLHAARMAVPVIMITGRLPMEEFIRYPWFKPVAMLPKPFTGDELLGTVQKALRPPGSVHEQVKPVPIWRRAVSRWFKAAPFSIPARGSD